MSTAELSQRLDRLEALITSLSAEAPLYLNTKDMLELTRLGRTTLNKLIQEGVVPAPYKLGGKNLWKRSEVISAINNVLK